MNIGDAVQKLVPIRTVQELEGWTVHYRPRLPSIVSAVPFLKGMLKDRYLETQCDLIYEVLCPDQEMRYQLFFTNALACAMLTFSYLEELEKTKDDQKAGEDLSLFYPKQFTNRYHWIENGLSKYPTKYRSLSGKLKKDLDYEASDSTEEQEIIKTCYEIFRIFPGEFLLPYSLLPEEIKFNVSQEDKESCCNSSSPKTKKDEDEDKDKEYYRIARFLSPITTEIVKLLVTNQAQLNRDADESEATEAIEEYYPPMLERHICTMFLLALRWAVNVLQNKPANTIAQNKSRLLKTYNSFIDDLLTPPPWCKKSMDFPDQVMLHYAWELLSHPCAIGAFEASLCEIEKRAPSTSGYLEDCQHARKLLVQRSAMPLVFWADETALTKNLYLQNFHDYLRAIVTDIYVCAERKLGEALELTRTLILSCRSYFPSLGYPNTPASDISPKSIKDAADREALEVGRVIDVLRTFQDHHYFDDDRQFRRAEIDTPFREDAASPGLDVCLNAALSDEGDNGEAAGDLGETISERWMQKLAFLVAKAIGNVEIFQTGND